MSSSHIFIKAVTKIEDRATRHKACTLLSVVLRLWPYVTRFTVRSLTPNVHFIPSVRKQVLISEVRWGCI